MTDFWAEVEKLLDPPRESKIFYRLYYDSDGNVLFYSMEDLPGNYIEIDADTFALGPLNVKVRHGKLIEISHASSKLIPGNSGVKCDPRDVTVITQTSGQCWTMKNYERNN